MRERGKRDIAPSCRVPSSRLLARVAARVGVTLSHDFTCLILPMSERRTHCVRAGARCVRVKESGENKVRERGEEWGTREGGEGRGQAISTIIARVPN